MSPKRRFATEHIKGEIDLPGSPKRQKRHRYSSLLRNLSQSHPKIAVELSYSHKAREESLSWYSSGVRLRGFEELIDHLDEIEQLITKSRRLRIISFLVARARSDFCEALECGLSRIYPAAFNAMRDVMEIEFLFREFWHDSREIEIWASSSQEEILARYRSGILRQKFADRLGVKPKELPEAREYEGHSMVLHVTPNWFPNVVRGDQIAILPFWEDAFFWDIYSHAEKFLTASHLLRRKVAPHIRCSQSVWNGLKHFRTGWESTQLMQNISTELMTAHSEASANKKKRLV